VIDWAGWDGRLSELAASLLVSRLRRLLAGIVAHSGDSQWWLIAGALLWWRGAGAWREAGIRMIVVTVAGGLASGIIKRVVRRPRPEGSAHLFYLQFDRHSFPSGHATRVAALVVALGAIAPWWGALGLGLWALAVGISRMALSLHFASDIAAGMALGVLLGVTLSLCWG
jgi:undecaprenyl-diphosphatase